VQTQKFEDEERTSDQFWKHRFEEDRAEEELDDGRYRGRAMVTESMQFSVGTIPDAGMI
jgi:hypothetical protein